MFEPTKKFIEFMDIAVSKRLKDLSGSLLDEYRWVLCITTPWSLAWNIVCSV